MNMALNLFLLRNLSFSLHVTMPAQTRSPTPHECKPTNLTIVIKPQGPGPIVRVNITIVLYWVLNATSTRSEYQLDCDTYRVQ
jgi:hypothetical protein